MTEAEEQRIVCEYMDRRGLVYFHVPNGAYFAGSIGRRVAQANKLKAAGVKNGVPDLMVVTPASYNGNPMRGVAIEMKRVKGAKPTEEQVWWLETLADCGYACAVAYGATAAIDFLALFDWQTTEKSDQSIVWEVGEGPMPNNLRIDGKWYRLGNPPKQQKQED